MIKAIHLDLQECATLDAAAGVAAAMARRMNVTVSFVYKQRACYALPGEGEQRVRSRFAREVAAG